jgi:cleavage and polyadenylation specificity factor subunit 2
MSDNSGQVPSSNILLPPPTTEEIASYFAVITSLKYSQVCQPAASSFTAPLEGLTITAYCAGHTLGGTIWHLQYGSESVVYAIDWNQGRENILPGAAWLAGSGATGAEVIEQLKKPTALICSSKGADSVATAGGLRKRDELLLSRIRETISAGGDVLIPCDSGARVLEIAYMLEHSWDHPAMGRAAKLYLASTTSTATMRYARSMLEWMDESVLKDFEATNTQRSGDQAQAQPFSFKYLKLLERKSQVTRAIAKKGPKVFLASDASMEWGFSKMLMYSVASNPQNLVILTEQKAKSTGQTKNVTLVQALQDLIKIEEDEQSSSEGAVTMIRQCQNEEIELQDAETTALVGDDIVTYQQHLARQRQRLTTLETEKTTVLESSADVVDDQSSSSSSSDEDEDPEHQGKALNISNTLAHPKHKLVTLNEEELGVNVLLRKPDVHDFDVRGKRGREKVFPFVARRRRNDEFGDVIRPEDFLRAEEKEDTSGQDATILAKDETALGQKRRWDDEDEKEEDSRQRGNNANKRRKTQRKGGQSRNQESGIAAQREQEEVSEESEESDYEPEEATIDGPSRVTFTSRKIVLRMRLTCLDLSGIHDRRSLHMLIPLIRPRKLVLTGGSAHETASLAEACRTMLLAADGGKGASVADVLTPLTGKSVDASVDTNAWTVKLDRKLYSRLNWQNFRTMGIVTITGHLTLPSTEELAEDETSAAKRQKLASADAAQNAPESTTSASKTIVLPLLASVPLSATSNARLAASRAAPTNRALHVGDLRLAELRRIMQSHGHTAEFKGEGTLLVDGIIAVRKSGTGKIEVESGGSAVMKLQTGAVAGVGSSFFDVRKKIYEGLAVVAAR